MTPPVQKLDQKTVDAKVAEALSEDAPTGDVTVDSIISADLNATATLTAREPGVMAGEQLFDAAFRLTDPRIAIDLVIRDGMPLSPANGLPRGAGPRAAD